jgi:hypothetical protein
MKRVVVLALFALFLVNVVKAITFQPLVYASAQVYPQAIFPGSDGFVQLTLKNVGTDVADRIKINQVKIDGPIKTAEWNADLGSLNPSDTSTYFFKFTVNPSASPGLYTIQFAIDYCKGSVCQTIYPNAIVNVQAPSTLELLSVSPSSLKLGEKANITFKIANRGEFDINNLVFVWSLPTNYTNFILPLGVGNRLTISKLPAKSTYDITIPVYINPSAMVVSLPLMITLQYTDKAGNMQLINLVAGLEITSETDFDVSIQEFSQNSLTLVVTNIGSITAYSTILRVLPSRNFILSPAVVVLGNLNAGDYTTATFSVQLLNITRNETNRTFERTFNITSDLIRVEVSYTDSSGVRRSVVKEITPMYTSARAISTLRTTQAQKTQFSGEGLTYILIGIVGIVALVLVFRYALRRGKKR